MWYSGAQDYSGRRRTNVHLTPAALDIHWPDGGGTGFAISDGSFEMSLDKFVCYLDINESPMKQLQLFQRARLLVSLSGL